MLPGLLKNANTFAIIFKILILYIEDPKSPPKNPSRFNNQIQQCS